MSASRPPDGPEAAPTTSTGTVGTPAVRHAVALPAGPGAPTGALVPAVSSAARRQEAATATRGGRGAAPDTSTTALPEPSVVAEAGPEAEEPSVGPGRPETATAVPTAAASTPDGRTTTGAPGEPSTTATRDAPATTATPDGSAATATASEPGGPAGGADDTHASGRPNKPLLAAAAIAGSLLIALPFALTSNEDRERTAVGLVTSPTAADTMLQDDSPARTGAYTATTPSPSVSSSASTKRTDPKPLKVSKQGATAALAVTEAPTASGKKEKKPTASSKATAGSTPDKAASGKVAGSAGQALVSAQSSKCLSAGNGKDGTQLRLWACDGTASQRWEFRPDGTIRALGMCMDVAGASERNLTAIQVAHCSGNPAQQFYLNSTQDLVARIATKCVDIYQGDTANGTPAVLFPCSGDPNQTWSKA